MTNKTELISKQVEVMREEIGDEEFDYSLDIAQKNKLIIPLSMVVIKLTNLKNKLIKILIISACLTGLFFVLDTYGLCPQFIREFVDNYIASNINQVYGIGIAIACFLVVYLVIYIFFNYANGVITFFQILSDLFYEFKIKRISGYPVPFIVRFFRVIFFCIVNIPWLFLVSTFSVFITPLWVFSFKIKAKKQIKRQKREEMLQIKRQNRNEDIEAAREYRDYMINTKHKKPRKMKIPKEIK